MAREPIDVDYTRPAPEAEARHSTWSLATHLGFYDLDEESLHLTYYDRSVRHGWKNAMRAECAAFVLRFKFGVDVE